MGPNLKGPFGGPIPFGGNPSLGNPFGGPDAPPGGVKIEFSASAWTKVMFIPSADKRAENSAVEQLRAA